MPTKLPKSSPISVFVAQAQEPKEIELTSILREAGTFAIAGEAATGKDSVQLIKQVKPNVVLVSGCFADMHGNEVAKGVKQTLPDTKLLILTRDDCIDHVLAAFDAGADGYYLCDAKPDEITSVVPAINAGACCIAPSVAHKILELCKAHKQAPARSVAENENCFGLKTRELQVLESIVDGCSNQEISARLQLRESTVKTHVRRILEKLAVSTRTEAAVKAIKTGVFSCSCYAPSALTLP